MTIAATVIAISVGGWSNMSNTSTLVPFLTAVSVSYLARLVDAGNAKVNGGQQVWMELLLRPRRTRVAQSTPRQRPKGL
jgi:hypothetical protein